MADTVPISGPWQSDPELQRLRQAFNASHAGPPRRGMGDAEAQAFARYVEANRQRLGIPDNYFVHPATGQLYDPNQNQLRNAALTGGAMAAGGLGLPELFGGGAAAPPAGTGPAGGIPIAYASGAAVPNAGALGASVAGLSPLGSLAPTAGNVAGNVGGNALASSIKDKLLSPQGLAGLAASISGLVAANSGGGGQTDAATQALLQEALKRSQRVDPLHQAVTQLAFSRLPDSARNGITLTGK